MTRTLLHFFTLLLALLTLSGSLPPAFGAGVQSTDTRRVNAPYFDDDITWAETAIFWLGQNQQGSPPTRNYTDVRLGYTDEALAIWLTVADYYLWYDASATPSSDLTPWDAAAVYLDTNGDGAAAPQTDDYWFLIGARHWQDVSNYMRQARGSGSAWNTAWSPSTAWTAQSSMSWYCDPGPNSNDCGIDFGWTAVFTLPWATLGLSGPPADGALWGLGVQVYDHDLSGGSPLTPEVWPETFASGSPATWGELAFNPPAYQPPAAVVEGSTTLRRGLNGAVEDAWMGGGGTCGGGHNGGGEINHGDSGDLYTGSETAVTHLPCFNKSYLRFYLDDIPAGRTILSASLTLHLWGHAGETPDLAQPSWVHLFSVTDPWQEMTIHWNNAPLPRENLSVTRVDPYSSPGDIHWPGDPYTWDATQAVAEAHAAGQPLSIALYASDSAQHSSKYYVGSESTITTGRPTLTVTWGRAAAELEKTVSPSFGHTGQSLTYTLSFPGTGNTLTLTDDLPDGVSAPTILPGSTVTPSYASGRLTWSGAPSSGQEVIVRYSVTIETGQSRALVNTAQLSEAGGEPSTARATAVANPTQVFLPLTLSND
ncbi:MAG: DNRLRE domain-containing protein [Chloroflexota bacterium]